MMFLRLFVFTFLTISFLIVGASNVISQENTEPVRSKVIIAKVADRVITLDDFISRAEFTIRPAYCKGYTNLDKKIVLNSLIAEKLFAIESDVKNDLMQNQKFRNMIAGRKEQRMRNLLSFIEGDEKVKLDSGEVEKIFSIAGRTYRIEYFNVTEINTANDLSKKYFGRDSSFYEIYKNSGIRDSIYKREVAWGDDESKKIHKALFSGELKKDQLVGPININDTTNIFIKINGWNDRVVISNTDVTERWSDVAEKLVREKADSIYDKFVLGVMGDKTLSFNSPVFNKIVDLLAPFYTNRKEAAEEEFLQHVFDKNVETPDLQKLGGTYQEIADEPFLSIDGKTWTVFDFKNEMDKHPLVFRKEDANSDFAHRLHHAVVDLVRDKYLTDAAYQRDYDRNEIVTHYEQSWLDASISYFQKLNYLKQFDLTGVNDIGIIEKYLNPYVESLLKKYSDQIEINVEEYEKIQLTRIDMMTMEDQVPYPVYVPAFPQITNYNRLDYGKKMNNN
ncbi:MAG: hypothetical protein V1720_13030 [bacterium]